MTQQFDFFSKTTSYFANMSKTFCGIAEDIYITLTLIRLTDVLAGK